ncbi:MAG: transcription-repair coupling factor [Lachnospiraceae bacterium]|nr:transcription-repair coupling factor [Lachnospiraceae bacterium]
MNALLKPLEGLADYPELKKKIKGNRGILQVSGCMDSQKVHLMRGLMQSCSHVFILAENDLKARELYEDYRFYDPDVLLYPAKDLLFYQADIHSNLLDKQRMNVIKALLEKPKTAVILSVGGCMDCIPPKEIMQKKVLHFEVEQTLDLDRLKEQLVNMGYERTAQAEMAGQFSVRGGIIDIFPLTGENPVRIELWGDEVDSIRTYDAESQRSLEELNRVSIYPATDRLQDVDMKQTISLLEYTSISDTLIFLDEPNRLEEAGLALEKEFRESMEHRLMQKTRDEECFEVNILGWKQIQAWLNGRNCISFCAIEHRPKDWKVRGQYSFAAQSVSPYNNSFELLVKDLKRWKKAGYRVALLSGSRTRAERLAKDLTDQDVTAFYSASEDREIQPGEIMVLYGHARRGFEYPMIKFVLITESDIFGKEKKKPKKKRQYSGTRIASFNELSIGDYVVHESHGLGIYRGIEKIDVDNVMKDYIKIEYNGSNLYILATQLDSLQKYSGSEAKKPKLNRLGGQEWKKTKTRVRGAVKDIAKDLVALYAARQQTEGFQYGPDTVWQREFEEMFPFEETEDQIAAIESVKSDMESRKIMDRLICGDVGYGKTEVAIRAAFKAVQENKQVVYLVPTTILAQQHYNTFVQRMKDYPVRVDLLCRFRTAAQQKKTITDLKKGFVDIVIGTHRVLSADVEYKDLGLLIIDEEQRFGVAHKEKIKKLKENVDVLTLTATPIPRTLHMSLIGIRDMSVLEEPPMDRVPIQTYVMEHNDELVREAICRELGRDGQVYYVYNRVNDIGEVASRISRLVPEARVEFAHGQMSERELEKIMYDFINGEIDVLVSTTIIETGLDISNVNTMIIQDADRMGLSQLYQLRGRVGRSNRTAYAFLTYRRNKMLKEVAEKRLAAIREFTELGSGIKIAMRDLEIRGAGNLLGAQQHGHMEAVGYDLYCKMLGEAVQEAKGVRQETEDFETVVDVNMDAFIPDSYISNEYQKLDIYKRIAGIENEEEYEDMLDELMDRFGEPPKSVQNLLAIANVKAAAHRAFLTEVKQRGMEFQLTLYENPQFDTTQIPELVRQYQGCLQFRVFGKNPYFLLQTRGTQEQMLQAVKEFSVKLALLGKKEYNDMQ